MKPGAAGFLRSPSPLLVRHLSLICIRDFIASDLTFYRVCCLPLKRGCIRKPSDSLDVLASLKLKPLLWARLCSLRLAKSIKEPGGILILMNQRRRVEKILCARGMQKSGEQTRGELSFTDEKRDGYTI